MDKADASSSISIAANEGVSGYTGWVQADMTINEFGTVTPDASFLCACIRLWD